MATTTRSKILKANIICWAGAILACLILTYGAHGPARHPKLLLPSVMTVGMLAVVQDPTGATIALQQAQ